MKVRKVESESKVAIHVKKRKIVNRQEGYFTISCVKVLWVVLKLFNISLFVAKLFCKYIIIDFNNSQRSEYLHKKGKLEGGKTEQIRRGKEKRSYHADFVVSKKIIQRYKSTRLSKSKVFRTY